MSKQIGRTLSNRKLYWGLAALILLLTAGITFMVVLQTEPETAPKYGVTPPTKDLLNTPKNPETQTEVTVEDPGNSPVDTSNSPVQGPLPTPPDGETDDRGLALEKELRQKSLRQLIDIIDDIPPEFIRADWFTEIVRGEINTLDPNSEESLKLEEAILRARPELVEQYEAETGRPHPPPGYTYVGFDTTKTMELVKLNTPVVRMVTSEQTGYGNWDQLSEVEWQRYKALNAISQQLLGPNHGVNREIAELAAEWKKPLYEKSWGTRIIETPSLIVSYNRPKTEEDETYERQLMREAMSKTTGNLPNVSHRVDHKVVSSVIDELKAAVRRR